MHPWCDEWAAGVSSQFAGVNEPETEFFFIESRSVAERQGGFKVMRWLPAGARTTTNDCGVSSQVPMSLNDSRAVESFSIPSRIRLCVRLCSCVTVKLLKK